MNSANFIGRTTKDIELRQTANGKAVGTFTLAVKRDYKNQNGEYESDFINCVAYGQTAETLAKYVGKGNQIGISAKVHTRNYENQQGQRVYVTEFIVNSLTFVESKSNNQQSNNTQQHQTSPYDDFNSGAPIDFDESELPF